MHGRIFYFTTRIHVYTYKDAHQMPVFIQSLLLYCYGHYQIIWYYIEEKETRNEQNYLKKPSEHLWIKIMLLSLSLSLSRRISLAVSLLKKSSMQDIISISREMEDTKLI